MTTTFRADPSAQPRWCAGPLGAYLESFGALLDAHGYARATEQPKLQLVATFSRWLARRGLAIGGVDERRGTEFVRARRTRRRAHRGDGTTIRMLLEHLRQSGVIPAPLVAVPSTERSRVEQAFSQYLGQERGLARATVVNYLPEVRRFLSWRFATDAFRLDDIRLPDVTRFVVRHAHAFSPRRVQLMLTALRAFFRFLRLHGDTAIDLASSVLSVADWRLARVPQWIPAAQVNQVLHHCDQHTRVGQRDYTIVLLLARLGLRAGEVVGMTLARHRLGGGDSAGARQGRATGSDAAPPRCGPGPGDVPPSGPPPVRGAAGVRLCAGPAPRLQQLRGGVHHCPTRAGPGRAPPALHRSAPLSAHAGHGDAPARGLAGGDR